MLLQHSMTTIVANGRSASGIGTLLEFQVIKWFQSRPLGLYRTSRPVRKYGTFSKSRLSGSRTFSFPDARLLTLLKIEEKNEKNKFFKINFSNFFFSRFFFVYFQIHRNLDFFDTKFVSRAHYLIGSKKFKTWYFDRMVF